MRLRRLTVLAAAIVAGTCACGVPASPAGPTAGPAGSEPPAASGARKVYVLSQTSNTVTPVDVATDTAGRAIQVGPQPAAIAITPDGRTAYVVDANDQTGRLHDGMVTPIATATDDPRRPIQVGAGPDAIAITPDGRTAYVANRYSGTVTPITIATDTPGKPVNVGEMPDAIAITPDGRTAYVANYLPSGGIGQGGSVTPIATATNKPGKPISIGAGPNAIAITPNGQTAYVLSSGGDADTSGGSVSQAGTVTPITVATNQAGKPIRIGSSSTSLAIAIAPNGQTVYVLADPLGKDSLPVPKGDGFVIPIATASNTPGMPIKVGALPLGLAITPDSKILYVADSGSGEVTPIETATSTAGHPISTWSASPVSILIEPGGQTAYALGITEKAFSGSLTPIAIATGKPGNQVAVGAWPSASAIVPGGHVPYADTVAVTSVLPLFESVVPDPVPTTTGPQVLCPVDGTPPTPKPCYSISAPG